VYLVTSWILGIFGVIISYYIYYYLRDILLDYVLVGVLLTIYMSMELVMRFLGGYLGDNTNRKTLSVLTMVVSGLALFVFAFANSFIWLLAGCVVLALSTLFASGSTSYIYENTPPEHAGRAMGLLQTSSGFGLLGLALITWLLAGGMAFVPAVQLMYLLGGTCYMVAAVVRAVFLVPSKPIARNDRAASTIREFFRQNWRALRYLATILPVFLTVLIVDALSDGLYNFVNMYYLNEALGFSIGEISLMLIVVLAFSIPLSITVGGFFDRHGSRRAITVVYSVMPLCLVLLLIAPLVPSWLPFPSLTAPLVTAYPILGPLLSTAFVATACKRINDILWWTLILTFLRRVIPRTETAKMISIFMIIVMISSLATPIPASIVYTLFGAVPVLVVTLVLNLAIFGILVVGNIQPKPNADKATQPE
jgi:predicted MFS family arabinose efflux permease